MALRDQPYLPLYVQDFLTDEKLMECSASATGIYIRLICIMHKSDEYGVVMLKQKDKQTDNQIKNFALKLAKYLPYNTDEIITGLSELISEGVLQNGGDKLSQKRMIKDNQISIVRADAGKKGGIKTQLAKAKPKAKRKAKSENEIDSKDKDINRRLLLKIVDESKFILPIGFENLILEWLRYKSEKGQTYKETGLKTLIKTFIRDSNSDEKIGREMLDYSMSKNYSGLFKEKKNENNSGNSQRSVKRVNDLWK